MTDSYRTPAQRMEKATLMQLQEDRIDLQSAIDKLVNPFERKYFPCRVELSSRMVAGEVQSTVTVTLP